MKYLIQIRAECLRCGDKIESWVSLSEIPGLMDDASHCLKCRKSKRCQLCKGRGSLELNSLWKICSYCDGKGVK